MFRISTLYFLSSPIPTRNQRFKVSLGNRDNNNNNYNNASFEESNGCAMATGHNIPSIVELYDPEKTTTTATTTDIFSNGSNQHKKKR